MPMTLHAFMQWWQHASFSEAAAVLVAIAFGVAIFAFLISNERK